MHVSAGFAALAAFAALAVLPQSGARASAETAAQVAAGVWAYVDAAGEVVVSGSFLGVPPDSALTPAALVKRRAFDFRTEDPVLGCGAPGMPRALTAGSPMTFGWNGDTLTIRYESMDVVRTVHMDASAAPAAQERTPNGYAAGRWDGDVLVIETSHLDGRIVDILGTPKGAGMTLNERYRIEEEGEKTMLRLDLVMSDPETFKEPYAWHFDFVLEPEWELLEYACRERPVELTPGVVPDSGSANAPR